jgi:hypothetical protein
MSYDLFFRAKNSDVRMSQDEFLAFFRKRKHYDAEMGPGFYGNKTTGVYFSFQYGAADSDVAEDNAERPLLPISFNINFFRPHIFALEAEPELAEFIRHFSLLVDDPQIDGMRIGEYSGEGFLRGWNKGNEFAYSGIAEPGRNTGKLYTLPGQTIEACWRWNFTRDDLQDTLGPDIFVPRIMFIDYEGSIRTVVAWIDGIPAAIPFVDCVIIPRDRFAPSSFFRRQKEKDKVLLHWSLLDQAILSGFRRVPHHIDYSLLNYSTPPWSVRAFIKSRAATTEQIHGVAVDQILDEDLVAKYRKQQ